MGKKILLLAATETFTVKGLAMKIKGIGVDAVYSSIKVFDIQDKVEGSDLVMFYIDDNVEDFTEAAIYIKDYCAENFKKVICIGAKSEHDQMKKLLPEEIILAMFERPLEMGKLLEQIEDYFSEESQQARRKSILIVDDDVQYMSMIMDWLKDTYRVSMANSGMSAITWLASNRADLILLDYEMPVVSGPKVLEMIRSDISTQNIPVMFLTGNADKESVKKVLSLKPADYLLKTIDKKGLHDKIDAFFLMKSAKT